MISVKGPSPRSQIGLRGYLEGREDLPQGAVAHFSPLRVAQEVHCGRGVGGRGKDLAIRRRGPFDSPSREEVT